MKSFKRELETKQRIVMWLTGLLTSLIRTRSYSMIVRITVMPHSRTRSTESVGKLNHQGLKIGSHICTF